MDDVARLCGLPDSKNIRPVINARFSEDALRTATMDAYGKHWREPMQATLEKELNQAVEVLGDHGLEAVSRSFPPVQTVCRLAGGRTGSQ